MEPGYYCEGEPSVCTFFHFEYGSVAGDTESTDNSTESLSLNNIRFFGTTVSTLYIHKNGAMSLDDATLDWTADTTLADHAVDSGAPMIAPFFSGEWDFSCGESKVYYRNGDSEDVALASEKIRDYYGLYDFTATDVTIVTYIATVSCGNNALNSGQIAIVSNSVRTFVLFLYSPNSIHEFSYDPVIGVHDGVQYYRNLDGILDGSELSLTSDMATLYTDRIYCVRLSLHQNHS